jgi:glutathione S-transferase
VALAEKDLPWESRHFDLRAGDQQRPEYLKLNPKGVVPTLVHDGLAIRESNVILEYLEDAFPEPSLRPRNPYETAQMRLWLKRFDEGHHDIATATLSMGIAFRFQYLEQGPAACRALIDSIPDPIRRKRREDVIYNGIQAAEFRTAIGMWKALLTDMENQLAIHEWLVGENFSTADAAYVPYLTRLEHLEVLDAFTRNRPQVADWFKRVKSRPSYKTAILDWEDPGYRKLMSEKGKEAGPVVTGMIEGNAWN